MVYYLIRKYNKLFTFILTIRGALKFMVNKKIRRYYLIIVIILVISVLIPFIPISYVAITFIIYMFLVLIGLKTIILLDGEYRLNKYYIIHKKIKTLKTKNTKECPQCKKNVPIQEDICPYCFNDLKITKLNFLIKPISSKKDKTLKKIDKELNNDMLRRGL